MDPTKYREIHQAILQILDDEIDLAQPDDVLYLEEQAPRIAQDILDKISSEFVLSPNRLSPKYQDFFYVRGGNK